LCKFNELEIEKCTPEAQYENGLSRENE